MKGNFFINGVDAFKKYGVFIAPGGYNTLIQYPSLKKVEVNDWPEEDGVDPDLSDPQLEAKDVSISFNRIQSDYIDELLYLLATKPYHIFFFPDINYTVKLRLNDQSNLRRIKQLDKFTLKFSDDFPLEGYICQKTVPAKVKQVEYDLDGEPFSDYGIWILDGSDEEIEKSPAVKKNLLIDHSQKNGVTYLGKQVVFESKDVTLKCLLQTDDIDTFWCNYNALLNKLRSKNEKQFYSERLLESFPCYYKSSTVNKFEILPDNRIWCEFSLVLVFTSFRVNEIDYILASDRSEPILSQDGQYLIDVKVYGNSKEEGF